MRKTKILVSFVFALLTTLIVTSDTFATGKEDQKETQTYKDGAFIETIQDASIYDNSTGSLVKVGTLNAGAHFKITKDYGQNWVEIKFGESFAYISKTAIKHSKNSVKPQKANVETFLYSKNKIKVYSSPSKNSTILGAIAAQNSYPVVSEQDNYAKVSLGGREGYVYKENVQIGEHYQYMNSDVWLKNPYFIENLSKDTRENLPNLTKGKVVDISKGEFSEWDDSLNIKVKIEEDIYLIDNVKDYWIDEKLMFDDPYETYSGWGWSEQVWKDIRDGKIRLGMDAQAVLLSWGAPDDTNTTTTQYGKHEQWVYEGYSLSDNDYLYFEDGILTTIQN